VEKCYERKLWRSGRGLGRVVWAEGGREGQDRSGGARSMGRSTLVTGRWKGGVDSGLPADDDNNDLMVPTFELLLAS
jgi:hypothetical protein